MRAHTRPFLVAVLDGRRYGDTVRSDCRRLGGLRIAWRGIKQVSVENSLPVTCPDRAGVAGKAGGAG